MNSSGNAEPEIVIRRPRLTLLLIAVVIMLAFLIGTQIIGVLYGIVFPPKPPLPPFAREVRHTAGEYGVDEWVYWSSDNACQTLQFYRRYAETCTVAPMNCDASGMVLGETPRSQHVGRCTGTITFSIFAMRWSANIATGDTNANETLFSLSRDISWTGVLPPPLPTP